MWPGGHPDATGSGIQEKMLKAKCYVGEDIRVLI